MNTTLSYCQHQAVFADMYSVLDKNGVRKPYELNPKPREVAKGFFFNFEPGSGVEMSPDGGLYGDCPYCAEGAA